MDVNVRLRLTCLCIVLGGGSFAVAEIRFEEVTATAGIQRVGQSKGAAWGDVDDDGWPDLWLSNRYDPPSLYLNDRDGSFTLRSDLIDSEATAGYGAQWCDLDGDGRLDLVGSGPGQHGGAGGPGRPNVLLLNRDGRLVDHAAEFGVARRAGRGRTPLCLDWNGDGRLDLVLSAMTRADGLASIALENRGTEGFEQVASRVGLSAEGSAFAALTRLTEGGPLRLFQHGWPPHLFSVSELPFTSLGVELGLPEQPSQDAAFADLDGDGFTDLLLVNSDLWASGVERVGPGGLFAALSGQGGVERSFRFRAEGPVTVRVIGSFLSKDQVLLGKRGWHPRRLEFELDPALGRFSGLAERPADDPGLRIGRRRGIGAWEVRYGNENPRWLAIEAPGGIIELQAPELEGALGAGMAKVFHGGQGGFEVGLGAATPCHSVSPGDFDNDGDLDLYLVCTGPVRNRANLVLENVGSRRFEPVPEAGGAGGSEHGRGESVTTVDFDRDGYLDLLVTNGEGHAPFNRGPVQLFRNLGGGAHWLEVDLEGRISNRDAIGAQVIVRAGGRTQMRTVGENVHRYSQSHARLHFGLGKADRIERLTIHWPNGGFEELADLSVDRILHRVEPARRGRQ